ncbi:MULTISPECIES: MarR family winged helix-turn-helix transcriptional regulator [Bradyrhizobium]|jgi:DNA-binding MarR family transcriptional regulator|uniref:MarR family transcriptional regulator n=1 Tax=Bradyrhizobium ottawaense TaxID=931866 RepID=A0A2U8P4M7_9BRAD|nr:MULTISPECIES: MarR family winged helix-turn-helix transcriptional regulator [Bradyrhizobium]AWL92334.1 MarR family transcriptional regulator [Bradyrhizobium ottawaense]MBR1288980.1 winged helix-turn-helix transcriptional regulator [Bradyrhizobium ottawaense]MBR1325469.1 winged helix-turn-helix transcriptional regulator [Bradyrhizobium ottawaense]MBR1336029.1 winged helix-turn-helix transcriptional regulator [Bradyrhizobium ottawaense]MDA9415007.1 MarR family transcriptional regulator [Brady
MPAPSTRPRHKPAPAEAGPTLDLERYVPAFVTFIANKLSNSATAFYQREFGVNVTEWRIMSLLAIEPGIPASRICHVIGFDKGPVSRTLAGLEKRGLISIRTDPHDGRTHSISLTAKGRSTHDKVIAAALERERRLLSCLSKDEREVLIGLLRRLHENLGAVTDSSYT